MATQLEKEANIQVVIGHPHCMLRTHPSHPDPNPLLITFALLIKTSHQGAVKHRN